MLALGQASQIIYKPIGTMKRIQLIKNIYDPIRKLKRGPSFQISLANITDGNYPFSITMK